MTYTDEDAKSDDHTVPIEAPLSLRAARAAMPGILADQSETALSELPPGVIEHRRLNAQKAQARADTERGAEDLALKVRPASAVGAALSQSALHVIQPLGSAPAWGQSARHEAGDWSGAQSQAMELSAQAPARSSKLWAAGVVFLLTALSLVIAVHLTLA